MKEKKTADIESRIRAVAAEMASITEFAEGSIKKAYSTYPVKGGGRRRSKTPQYKFQTRGGRGRQKVVHIPAGQVGRVRELLENGRRYRRLEAEYSRLATEAALAGLKKKRRLMRLPRPRLVNVLALLEKVERMPAGERREALPRIDGDLKRAVTEDMAGFTGEVVSAVAFGGGRGGVHSVRTGQFFCAFGWAEAGFPYRRGGGGRRRAFDAFGIRDKLTPYAADEVARLGVGLGSFGEAHRVMSMLHCGRLSESKIRDATLAAGEAALKEQENPAKDVRAYTPAQTRAPDGSKEVPRTLVAMADGTNAPSVKADTRGARGKNGGEAGSRQIRVVSFCEYERTTEKGVPIPIRGSFSYAATDGDAARLTGMIRRHGDARGYGTVPRMQCVADGEEALEKAMRDAFRKDMVFTNDFMHASGYLSKCVNALGIADPDREYKTCRGIMLRIGAGSAVKRIRRLYADRLAKSKEAASALDYLDKRKDNMNYGWLRKNGYYISSCHIEAAARILVARRCKQAGMHWRHHNAARVAALIAKYRSAA